MTLKQMRAMVEAEIAKHRKSVLVMKDVTDRHVCLAKIQALQWVREDVLKP